MQCSLRVKSLMYDFAIIGGGIVGLSTGMALGLRYPNARIVVLEEQWSEHQTGNSTAVSFTLAFTTSQGVSKLSSAVKVVARWWNFTYTVFPMKFAAGNCCY